MTIAVWIGLATFLTKALEGAVSSSEGTFLRRQWRHMHMAFVNNWAICYGDGLIFPVINALVVPRLIMKWNYIVSALVGGLIVSYLTHLSWWNKPENLGHVFADWDRSKGDPDDWFKDLTKAGWIHFVFMALQTAVILLYIISPMPWNIVAIVAALFFATLTIINLQAQFIQGSVNVKFLVYSMLAVCVITFIKL
jgi:hypothetical protein